MRLLPMLPIAMVLMLAGCTHPVTLGGDTGQSMARQIQNQTFDPEAARNLQPVEGLDGQAAAIVVDQYRKSFMRSENGAVAAQPAAGVTTTTKISVLGSMIGEGGGR
jgi:hypothetical protein